MFFAIDPSSCNNANFYSILFYIYFLCNDNKDGLGSAAAKTPSRRTWRETTRAHAEKTCRQLADRRASRTALGIEPLTFLLWSCITTRLLTFDLQYQKLSLCISVHRLLTSCFILKPCFLPFFVWYVFPSWLCLLVSHDFVHWQCGSAFVLHWLVLCFHGTLPASSSSSSSSSYQLLVSCCNLLFCFNFLFRLFAVVVLVQTSERRGKNVSAAKSKSSLNVHNLFNGQNSFCCIYLVSHKRRLPRAIVTDKGSIKEAHAVFLPWIILCIIMNYAMNIITLLSLNYFRLFMPHKCTTQGVNFTTHYSHRVQYAPPTSTAGFFFNTFPKMKEWDSRGVSYSLFFLSGQV